MAQKRMFSKHISNDERFLEMPLSTQALYFHLGMNADDDGFISPKLVMRMCGAKEDDMKLLVVKGFVLQIPDTENVIIITHWKVNNDLKNDRYHPSFYKKHLENLGISDNKTYVVKCIQNVSNSDTQYSIGKDRVVEEAVRITDALPIPLYNKDQQATATESNEFNENEYLEKYKDSDEVPLPSEALRFFGIVYQHLNARFMPPKYHDELLKFFASKKPRYWVIYDAVKTKGHRIDWAIDFISAKWEKSQRYVNNE